MRLRGGIAVFIAATVIAPATASAAMRYTAPSGSGSACTEASPCSLPTGVSGASAGDEVRMTADEYNLTSQLEITVPNLTIAGPPGRYTPSQFQAFMIFSGAATTVANIRVSADGFTLRRVSISGQSGGQILINSLNHDNMQLDRVRVFDNGSQQTIVGQDALITNSVIRQDAGTYAAVNITGAIFGSTITSATGRAIVNDDAYHDSAVGAYCDLQVLNTIAIGAVSNLQAVDGGSACAPAVQYAYSWIPAAAGSGGGGIAPSGFITAGEGNLPDSPPALSSPLGGGIELALDSPAINAGCGGSCGDEDFYGRPRPIGAGNDIGATETILPPTLSPVSVGTVDVTSAAVSATVNPNGGATTYNFQIRKAGTSDWGSFDGATTGEGAADEPVSGTARPLDPSTGYEVRVVGSNSAGEVAGSPVAFRTPATPASLTVSSLKAKVGKRGAYFTSRATVNTAGSLAQTATTGSGRKTKTWCRTMTTVRRAAGYPLKCNLGSKGRRYLKKRSLALTVKTTLRAATGTSVTNTRKLTIKRRR